jgi:hypothetical protein
MYRIINQLIEVGYIIREIERDKSCRIVRVRYITTDEPIQNPGGGTVPDRTSKKLLRQRMSSHFPITEKRLFAPLLGFPDTEIRHRK